MLAAEQEGERTLIDELLDEQRNLTAANRFSRWHHENGGEPALARHYRELIPLTKPRPGEQYAFEVDLDKCSGCKACVSACHSLNGLDEGELWRSVGMLIGGCEVDGVRGQGNGNGSAAVLQHVTTACHHCAEPGCADGCPVLAYEKDPVTGIVRHLDDQCIGCQYCILKCPYDVPKFSPAKGIVRKCDMCHGRLAVGEAPACVQACPHEAIRIALAPAPGLRKGSSPLPHINWFPGAPDPHITLPATRYLSTRRLTGTTRPVDADLLRLEPAHWPLVVMLVLTQLAAGLHLLHALLSTAGWFESLRTLAWSGLAVLMIGLGASVAHLGRPLKAWRVFLGWRRSWMSREIIAFTVYAGLATLLVCQ
jgi:Fe-S-cluster-containing dehydrogenase component